MKRILIFSIVCLTSIIVSLGQSVESTILPPTGYTREVCDEHSFAAYLRQLPLLPKGSKVLLYNGQEKRNQAAAFAVVDMEIGNRDLQQCADAVMRLRAEYLWAQKRYGEIKFNFTNGFPAEYKKWAEGNRIKVTGNKVEWYAAGGKDYSYKTFRKYLNMVFMYAGTASLSKEPSYGSLYFTASRRCVYQRRFTGPCRDSSRCGNSPENKKESFFIGAKLYARPANTYPRQSCQPKSVTLV